MEDNEDLEEEFHDAYEGQDAIIFLIDASASMFQISPVDAEENVEVSNDCPFILALRCVHSTLCKKILTAPNDYVAIVLFGTKKMVPNDKYGVYSSTLVLQDLKKPDGHHIKALEKLFKNYDEYKKSAGNPQSYSLTDPLWLCSSIFSKHKSKNDKKHIFLFTNNDEPHSKVSDINKQAERRFGDLQDDGVSFFLFPIGDKFEAEKIYKELLVNNNANILPGSMTIEELLSKTCRKCEKKRTAANVVFKLSDDLKFGVKLYNLVRSAPKPKRIQLDKRTNEPVKSVTTKFNAETAETLLPSELTKSITVCDQKIRLDRNDLASLKSKFPPGMTLLGFKPIDKLKLHLFLSPAGFIYPDEDLVKGSRLIFGALLERCKARKYSPVCSFKATAVSKPRVVALLPHIDEEQDPDQASLFGFHVIYLPYLNDLRKFPYEDLVGSTVLPNGDTSQAVPEILRAGPNQIEAAKAIVKKMTMKDAFSPQLFEDPSLHTKWKRLEERALERAEVNPIDDVTLPDCQSIDKRLGERSAKFKDLVFPMEYRAEYSQPTASQARGPENDLCVVDAAKRGKLHTVTVDKLKGYLLSQGLQGVHGKKKAELIEIVNLHLK